MCYPALSLIPLFFYPFALHYLRTDEMNRCLLILRVVVSTSAQRRIIQVGQGLDQLMVVLDHRVVTGTADLGLVHLAAK